MSVVFLFFAGLVLCVDRWNYFRIYYIVHEDPPSWLMLEDSQVSNSFWVIILILEQNRFYLVFQTKGC